MHPMSQQLPTCPKCQSEMIRGFMFDFGFARSTVSLWYEGIPKKGLLGGTKIPAGEKCLPTVAIRCSRCGCLEFYASSEFGPQ